MTNALNSKVTYALKDTIPINNKMVKCNSDGCQRHSDQNRDGLCGVCHRVIERIQQNRDARGQMLNDRRNMDVNNVVEGPAAAASADLPPIDMAKMSRLYRKVIAGEEVSSQDLMSSVFGMMIHMSVNMDQVNVIKADVQKNTDRIIALEAKVGNTDEVATSLGLAIQNLPIPENGDNEVQNVRKALNEIHAPNVDVNRDITKAVRRGFKAETRPGANDGKVGTVLVEVSNSDVKARIMKNKRNLDNHDNQVIKDLRIKNMKTKEELNYEFSTKQLLKMIPGGENWYVAGNGRLNQVRPGGVNQRRPTQHPPPVFRREVPPPAQAAAVAPVQGIPPQHDNLHVPPPPVQQTRRFA